MSIEMYLVTVISQFANYLIVSASSVGIATRYGLDGPEIESLWEVRFSLPIQTRPEDHPASYTTTDIVSLSRG
jgi:hypothetical protein